MWLKSTKVSWKITYFHVSTYLLLLHVKLKARAKHDPQISFCGPLGIHGPQLGTTDINPKLKS